MNFYSWWHNYEPHYTRDAVLLLVIRKGPFDQAFDRNCILAQGHLTGDGGGQMPGHIYIYSVFIAVSSVCSSCIFQLECLQTEIKANK